MSGVNYRLFLYIGQQNAESIGIIQELFGRQTITLEMFGVPAKKPNNFILLALVFKL